MSKRKHQIRTTAVFVPELDCKVAVRGPTDGELKGDGQPATTAAERADVLAGVIGARVVSPRLTPTQIRDLSGESVERICRASMRLHPQTAALLRRGQ